MGRRPQVIVDGQMGRPRPDGCEGLGCEITDCDLRRVSSFSLALYSEYLGLRPTGSSRGVQVQFAEHLHRNMLWIPNPLGQHTFSCRAAEWPKRYRTIINPQ